MNKAIKAVIIILIILYIVSPIDALPGPIDDIIVALIGLATAMNSSSNIKDIN